MKTTAAQTAKEIRTELKKAFPNQLFRVTSKTYSGGSSVRVYWDNGPTTAAVDAIVKRHEYGHFDAMDDMYHMSNVRKDISQVQFVLSDRHYSDEIRQEAFAFCTPGRESIDGYWSGDEVAFRMLREMDLTDGFKVPISA